jgi:hypothetical protein
MGARHRGQRRDGRVIPARDMRQVEHRKVRHQATLQLREAVFGADPDDLVVAQDVRRHGYGEVAERPEPRAGSRQIKHLKTPFWKRRTPRWALRGALATTDLDL